LIKKLVVILLFYHFFLAAVSAQWIQQVSGTTDQLLRVKFINRYTGWTCGYNGRMLKTTNGGINWNIQNTGISGITLRSLNVVDSNILYSVGLQRTIIKTTNGGNNWIILNDGQMGSSSYWGSYFINASTGWICSNSQKILKTTNGGISFDSVYIPTTFMYDVYFINPLEGLACGQGASMYKTTNGGLNWSFITVPTGGALADFYNFSFINYNTGFVIGDGNRRLFKTTNFGLTWDSTGSAPGYEFSYFVFFRNALTGWTGGSSAFLHKTTNGGYNWYHENISHFGTGFFGGVYFYNDTIGWAVGAPGKILYTETGGQITQIINTKEQISNSFELYQNYPNPFNPNTNIKYQIALRGGSSTNNKFITLKIFDLLGREVAILVNEFQKTGTYEVVFDASGLTSGIYFYKLTCGDFSETKRMLLIK